MRIRRIYLRTSVGGLAYLVALMVIVAALHGEALGLFYLAYYWVILCAAVGVLLLILAGLRRTRQSLF